MDTFKIVSTKEKNGVYFTVVPHRWESNGILLWPQHLRHSQREQIRCNASSIPDENWDKHKCIVKCTCIGQFKDALKMEKKLSECIDTDAEEVLFTERDDTKRRKHDRSVLSNRTNLFDIVEGDKCENRVESPAILPVSQDGEELFELIEIERPAESSEGLKTEISELRNDFVNFRAELRNDFLNFKTEIKTEIKQSYAKVAVCLDKILDNLGNQNMIPNIVNANVENQNLLIDFNFPLSMPEEIDNLEAHIRSNPEIKNQLIDLLSTIGGRSGEEDGFKVGYRIADYLFKPELLTQFSWTGVSRGKSLEKRSFQVMDGILDVIYQVIALADNRHTIKKNCAIFKDGVLKHAKKRTERKRVRVNNNQQNLEVADVENIENAMDNMNVDIMDI